MQTELEQRLQYLSQRLHTVYEGIGHSSGRPYIYFIYPPHQERAVRLLVEDYLHDDDILAFLNIDILPITIRSLAGQEERRQELLNASPTAADAVVRLWTKNIVRAVTEQMEAQQLAPQTRRPVVVLSGLAALHPLTDPTRLMEGMAEQELRDSHTGLMVPIVLLVPGTRPPQTSRCYNFLGVEELRFDFYRGEEA